MNAVTRSPLAAALAACCCAVLVCSSAARAQAPPRTTPPQTPMGGPMPFMFGPNVQIGVTVRNVTSADLAGKTVEGGAFVTSVRPGSPAADAGLKVSDVITEFDGERVRSVRQLERLVEETPPGRTVEVALTRNGQRQTVKVTPAAQEPFRAGANGFPGPFNMDLGPLRSLRDRLRRLPEFAPAPPRLGVTIQEMTPALANYFGAKSGVLVASVTDGSAASRAGLEVGDVITSAAGQDVHSRADLLRAMRSTGTSLSLGIVRNKRQQTVTVTLGAAAPARPRQPMAPQAPA
jgi:S1-C subfamily serine protease